MTILETLQPSGGGNVPLDPNAGGAPAFLDDLPGNILASHGRFFATLRFLRFTKPAQAIAWLKEVGGTITTAAGQSAQSEKRRLTGDGGLFVALYLTAEGAKFIGRLEDLPPDDSFRRGAPARAGALGDGTANDPLRDWKNDVYHDSARIHALLLLAFNPESKAEADAFFTTWLKDRAEVVVHATEEGGRFTDDQGRNVEHFGYVDGISRMNYLAPDQPPATRHRSVSDFTYRLDHVLRTMPRNDRTCGSFLVFRKLEQNVALFRKQVDALAKQAPGAPDAAKTDLAGAAVVGRFPDGTPLAVQSVRGLGPEDDFTHGLPVPDEGPSAGGRQCPFHGHTRKMNPRGDPAVDDGGVAIQARQPTRRSLSYGVRALAPHATHQRVLAPDLPTAGKPVGLLFMAHVKDITLQFEHLIRKWANNPSFPHANSRLDPLIGRLPGRDDVTMVWPREANGVSPEPCSFASCVTARGGVYCFAPPRSFFTGL